ncbi:hypothetical protein D3C83_21260 [compost metagenome]
MGVHHAIDVLARLHDFRVNEHFGVALVFAFNFLAGFDIDDDDMLWANFFEAKAVGLHENLVLPRHPDRHMAENVVPVTFVRQDVAGVCEILFKFFDAGGHGYSLSGIVEVK